MTAWGDPETEKAAKVWQCVTQPKKRNSFLGAGKAFIVIKEETGGEKEREGQNLLEY